MNETQNIKRSGLLVVLSSPSGGGKTSVCQRLLKMAPEFRYSVSVTTRPPRANEVNGVDYHFKSKDEFEELIAKEAFAEYAFVHGHYYGSLREPVLSALAEGAVLLFDIDVQGGTKLKKNYEDSTVLIFILPPSFDELVKRLKQRGTESEEQFKLRIRNALWEYTFWPKYDYLVINDDLDKAVDKVYSIIKAERSRVSRIRELNWNLPDVKEVM